MTWMLLLLLAGLAAGLGFMRYRRGRPAPVAARPAVALRAAPNSRRMWGKEFIVPDPAEACPEARALNGKCFAYGKVPPVPLAGCTRNGCTCHFRDLGERRGGGERRSGHERREAVRFEDTKDRRVGKDRRASDSYDWQSAE